MVQVAAPSRQRSGVQIPSTLQIMNTERKLGVPFIYKDGSKNVTLVPYKTNGTNCDGCYFKRGLSLACIDIQDGKNLLEIGPCDCFDRVDKTSVVFKESLETNGDLIKQAISWDAYKWVELHKNQKAKFWMGVYLKAKKLFPKEIRAIIKTDNSPWKNKDNLAPFWDTFVKLINKRMKPITVKDLRELIADQPDEAEVAFIDDGSPVSIADVELNTKGESPIFTISLE